MVLRIGKMYIGIIGIYAVKICNIIKKGGSCYMKKRKILTMLALLLASCAALYGKDVGIVKNGNAQAVIVISAAAGPTEKFASEELYEFIKKITGSELKITEQAIPGKNTVRFLPTDAPEIAADKKLAEVVAKLKDDGYVIAAGNNSIRIVSNHKRGYLYGVYEILKKYGGVVWLYPGEEGEICPKKDSFQVPEQLTVRNPAFPLRVFRNHSGLGKESLLWQVRSGIVLTTWVERFSKKSDMTDFIAKFDPVYMEGGHSLGMSLLGFDLLHASSQKRREVEAELMKEHPEYFGLRNGKRVPLHSAKGDFSQVCTTNPEGFKRMADNLDKRLDLYGDKEIIRTLCNDDHSYWCGCDACRKLDPPEEAKDKLVSTRWWTYVNQMADALLTPRHPNLTIDAFLYQNFRIPPTGCKPDPRVMVTMCPHGRCYIHSLTDEKCSLNKRFRDMFQAWSDLKLRAHTFEYHINSPVPLCYELNEKPWIEDLKFYHKLNMMGFGLVTNVPDGDYKGRKGQYRHENYWFANWQLHYLSGVFAWDIDADFETESDRANSLYYGKAWEYIKPYRALLKGAITKNGGCMGYGVSTGFDIGECYDDPVLQKEVTRLLDAAAKAVAGESVYEKRVARDREYLAYEWDTACRSYVLTKTPIPLPKVHKETMVIDGVLDEKVWSIAPEITDFKSFGPPPAKAQIPTIVKIVDDGANLYFGIKAMKNKKGEVVDSATEDGLRSLKGSHFEIFVMPPWYKNAKYYHIGFTHNGKSYQALTTSPTDRDLGFRIDFEFAVKDYPDHWTAEVKFPVKKFGGCLSPRQLWRINVARMALLDSGKLEWTSISNGIFHEVPYYRTFKVSPWPGKGIAAGEQYPYPEKLKIE